MRLREPAFTVLGIAIVFAVIAAIIWVILLLGVLSSAGPCACPSMPAVPPSP